MKINKDKILIKIAKSNNTQRQAFNILSKKVEFQKQNLIDNFNNNEITKEIEAGPDLKSSQFLPNGYGNLFSFLGFSDEANPIGPINSLLNTIHVQHKPISKNNHLIYKIAIPDKSVFRNNSKMEWESGRSWIDAITYGLGGFSFYLHSLTRKFKNSRSGSAIQAKSRIRSNNGYLVGHTYLWRMLTDFKNRIKK